MGDPSTTGQEEEKPTPSFMDRLFGTPSSDKEQLDKEREEFEKQKEDEKKEQEMKEKMEEMKKVETIQTDLFKQLPDKSSPEYEKVKKLMIEQIKLIHKYNLLKQESFQLMLDNSKCQTLEEENKEQKEQIKDLENKIFNIIQQILGSKTSNRGLNKLNKDLLKTPNKLRKKMTPKKYNRTKTPIKPKINKVYKNKKKRTPTKSKGFLNDIY